MVSIFSMKKDISTFLLGGIFVVIIGIFYLHDYGPLGIIAGIGWAPIVLLVIAFVYVRGRKLEITEKGINMGKKYIGPLKSISSYKIPKYNKSELFLSWNNIKNIRIGTWKRAWARHYNVITASIAGEKMKKKEAAELAMGVPAKEWVGYFFIVQDKSSKIYAIEINLRILEKIKRAIKSFGKENLILSEKVKL